MDFVEDIAEEYTEGREDANYRENERYGNQEYVNQGYNPGYRNNQGPPRVFYPWEAEWDDDRDSWIFINRETGQRTHEYPQTYGGGGLGGYEGRRFENDYERDKYRVENDIEYAPENAARWGGERVEEVERIPEDVDRWERRKVEEVEEVPEDVARWSGRRVQEVEDIPENMRYRIDNDIDAPERWAERREERVEDFDNRVEYSYEQGERREEYRDEDRYDRY